MSSEFNISDWLTVKNAADEHAESIRNAVRKFFTSCEEENILDTTRMIFHPLDVAWCDLTYAFVL